VKIQESKSRRKQKALLWPFYDLSILWNTPFLVPSTFFICVVERDWKDHRSASSPIVIIGRGKDWGSFLLRFCTPEIDWNCSRANLN
jgi:hypothetical protein